jgi:tetratricopeptide (TPR) repeat protein
MNRKSERDQPKKHSAKSARNPKSNRKIRRPVIVGVPIPIPNSTSVLPDPLWLEQKDIEMVLSLERSLYEAHNIKPGKYVKWEEVKEILFPVHDKLIEKLESRINELDATSLVIQLYDQLEIMYGTLEKHRFEAMAATALTGDKRIPLATDIEWRVRSPQLLGLRYLIEFTVKVGSKSGNSISTHTLSELMALSTRIGEMDAFMEHVSCGIVPYELLITEALVAQFRLSETGVQSMESWQNARKDRIFQGSLEELAGLQRITTEPIKESQLTEDKVWKKLDIAMKSEKGYSLTEWLHFFHAVISSFDNYERLKILPKEDFVRYLRDATKLESQVINRLLDDRILSRKRMAGLSKSQMLPSENFWRDLRIANRPIIEMDEGNTPMVIFGIETTQQCSKVYFQLLTEGRWQAAHCDPDGPVIHVLGSIHEKSGDVFRDEVLENCRKMGLEAVPEKAAVNGIKLPQGIGPVDVFVFERHRKRFVLVECKDVSFRITPKELRNQKEEFIGKNKKDTNCFLGKLRAKEDWFRSHLKELREEYGLGPDQKVDLAGVIVVNHSMIWVYSHPDPIPVLDNNDFFDKLRTGEALVYRRTYMRPSSQLEATLGEIGKKSGSSKAHAGVLLTTMKSKRRALFDSGLNFMQEHRYDDAINSFRDCLESETKQSNRVTMLSLIGNCCLSAGRLKDSEESLKEAKEIAEELNDREMLSAILGNMAIVFRIMGELDKSLEYSQLSLNILRELGNREGEAGVLDNMGIIYRIRGQLDKAIEHSQLSLKIHREIDDRKGEACVLGNIGNVYQAKGDLEKALEYYGMALKIHEEVGNQEGEANNLGSMGIVYAEKGQSDKAMYYLQLALMVHGEIGNREGEAISLGNIGNVYQMEGDLDRAIEHQELALRINREIGNRESEANDLGGLANSYEMKGQYSKAFEYYQSALRMFKDIGAVESAKQTKKAISKLKRWLN